MQDTLVASLLLTELESGALALSIAKNGVQDLLVSTGLFRSQIDARATVEDG